MIISTLYNILFGGYDKLELILQNAGMSAAATDFMMIGTGVLLLIFLSVAAIGLIMLYGSLLIASYIRMIKLKNVNDRKKWALIFIVTLIIIVVDLMIIIT